MKNSTYLFAVLISFTFGLTACDHYRDNEDNNAKLHQEILPKGQKSDIDTVSTLTIGQEDSISNPPK
ncbi:MAG: hypothetical protein H0U95_15830 [Bacteroidetes bacterium]|nr:hypothetical protein [Bacteroidota bacterium]